MSDSLFSATQFLQANVLSSTLWVNSEQPDEEVRLSAELSLAARPESLRVSDDGSWVKEVMLSVSVTLRDDDEEAAERMRAAMVLLGGARFPKQEEISEEAINRHLTANTISSLYAASRSYLEFMTSMTPVRRFTLPAIDPYKVADESGS